MRWLAGVLVTTLMILGVGGLVLGVTGLDMALALFGAALAGAAWFVMDRWLMQPPPDHR